jgi:hypothetical protein
LREAAAAAAPPPPSPESAPWLSYVGRVRERGKEFVYFKNRRTNRVIGAVVGGVHEGYRLLRRPDGTFVLSWDGSAYIVGGD